MKLLIDIGNTNTALAVAKGRRILKRYFIRTSRKQVGKKPLRRLLGANIGKIDTIIIMSVVPKFLPVLKKGLKAVLPGVPLLVVGPGIKVPVRNKYKKPGQVGQDRLVTAFAASRTCGAPVLIVDFGTAVTMDYVNQKGEYEGGLIFPGLRLALGSLAKNAALLPKVYLKPTKGLIGKDTQSSMNNGVLYGYAAMCDGLIELLRKKYGRRLKVVATGGDAALVARYSRHIKKVDPDLALKGLNSLKNY